MRLSRLTTTVAAVVVVVDAVTKVVVAHVLTADRPVHAGPFLQFDLYYNHAGAGNALTGRSTLVSLLAIIAVLAIAALAGRARNPVNSVGLGMLLGGGVGNLADRVFGAPGPLRGGVIDWIRLFGGQGSMNLADIAINLGLVVLALGAVHGWWMDARRRPDGPSEVAAPL